MPAVIPTLRAKPTASAPTRPKQRPGQPGHRTRDAGAHAEAVADLLEDRAGRRGARAQVDRDEDDRGDEDGEGEGCAARAVIGVGHVHRL